MYGVEEEVLPDGVGAGAVRCAAMQQALLWSCSACLMRWRSYIKPCSERAMTHHDATCKDESACKDFRVHPCSKRCPRMQQASMHLLSKILASPTPSMRLRRLVGWFDAVACVVGFMQWLACFKHSITCGRAWCTLLVQHLALPSITATTYLSHIP